MQPLIISAFPSLGKTYTYLNSNYKCVDSDSSKFSWIYIDGVKTEDRNPEFPSNYINHIKELQSNTDLDFIFVSSHDIVKTAMDSHNIKFISIYPDKSTKESYMENLRNRTTGLADENFINLIDKNWDNWIPDNVKNSDKMDYNLYKNCAFIIYLGKGIFLSDALEHIKHISNKNEYCKSYLFEGNKIVMNESKVYDSTDDTLEHQQKVQTYINVFSGKLIQRGKMHDISKLTNPEKECFDMVTPKLKGLTYGSDEYRNRLREMEVGLKHHYSVNRHHPEHFKNGISDMNLIDIVEMICDWYAASQRHDNGDIYKSIEINQKRFKYSDDIKNIFINTIKELDKKSINMPDGYSFEVGV